MVKKISFFAFFIISTFIFSFSLFSQSSQNTLTITTYYPAPFGVYKELRTKRMAIGDNYYKSSDYSWGVDIDSDADLVVEGNVGIGTTDTACVVNEGSFNAKLKVDGDIMAVGNIGIDTDRDMPCFGMINKNNHEWTFCDRPAGELSISYSGASGGPFHQYITVLSNGNVGIGTTNPQAVLHVNGNIIADYPNVANHVATKAYVDDQVGGGIITISSCHWVKAVKKCPGGDCAFPGQKSGHPNNLCCKCPSGEVLVGISFADNNCFKLDYLEKDELGCWCCKITMK